MTTFITIHGGETWPDAASFQAYLRSSTLTLDRLVARTGWKDRLALELGDLGAVLQPRMPKADDAQYADWALWFEKVLALVSGPLLLIGHSLGGSFLAKYMAETLLPAHVRVTGTLFVAASYSDEDTGADLASFRMTGGWAQLQAQAGRIALFHSRDDFVVPFADVEKFAGRLPRAILTPFDGRGHFLGAEFDELVAVARRFAALSDVTVPHKATPSSPA